MLAHLGGHGVTLFFAISGFLITTLLIRELGVTGSIDLKAFYARRTLRIFPLYYAVLLLYVVLVFTMERNTIAGRAFFDNLPYFLSYTSNLFVPLDGRTIFYFSWSLAAEEQFYLIWPALFIFCRTPHRAALVLILAGTAAAFAQFMGAAWAFKVPVAIIAGALFAILLSSRSAYDRVFQLLGRSWSILPVLGLVIFALSHSQPPAVLHVGLALLVVVCVIREDHLLAPLLKLPVLRYLGEVSYGMYLLHMLCKNAAAKLLKLVGLPVDSVWLFLVSTVLTVVVARLSFRYFESYFLALKERFSTAR